MAAFIDQEAGVAREQPEIRWRHGTVWALLLLSGSPLVVGTTYLLVERARIGDAPDRWFVWLLLIATCLLLIGLSLMKAYVERRGPGFFDKTKYPDAAVDAKTEVARFIRATFSDRWMLIGGLTYGLLVASGVTFMLYPRGGDRLLAVLLWLFLFVVNYVAGMGFTGLILLFRSLWQHKDRLVVTIWRRSNESTRFVDDIRVRSATLAAAYVGLSLTSVKYSELDWNVLVVAYSVFATVVILVALIVPDMVIRSRLEAARGEAMVKLEHELKTDFSTLLSGSSLESSQELLKKIDAMLTLRDRIEGLAPPLMGWRTMGTALGVIVMPMLPVVFDKLLTPVGLLVSKLVGLSP